MLIAKEEVRSIRERSRQATLLKHELHSLIANYRPGLLAEVGCGTITAAILIGQTAGAERFATDAQFARMAGVAPIPASSGKRERHRLHRGGNRRMNHALHIIAITRARRGPATKACLQRKEARPRRRLSDASSATSHAASTACSSSHPQRPSLAVLGLPPHRNSPFDAAPKNGELFRPHG